MDSLFCTWRFTYPEQQHIVKLRDKPSFLSMKGEMGKENRQCQVQATQASEDLEIDSVKHHNHLKSLKATLDNLAHDFVMLQSRLP